jgi:hypothetical protein
LEGGTDALQEAGADQRALIRRQAAKRRGDRENEQPEQENAPASQEVAEPSGEQQQASEHDEEGVDHPRQVALGEMQVALDRRQGDIHDCHIEHDHQLREADNRETHPAAAFDGRSERGGCGHLDPNWLRRIRGRGLRRIRGRAGGYEAVAADTRRC